MKFIYLLLCAFAMSCGDTHAQNPTQAVPVPTPAQVAWQDAELAAVFHYDLHVFDGEHYSQPANRITPIADYNMFNPKHLDTDQWIRSAKAMGAKVAIITATHETGFALYQSDVNPYCMKALRWRDGKGDIVRDFVASCRKYGIRPGVYIGIQGKVGGRWALLAKGSCIGHKKIDALPDVEVSALRLVIDKAVGEPLLKDFSAYAY